MDTERVLMKARDKIRGNTCSGTRYNRVTIKDSYIKYPHPFQYSKNKVRYMNEGLFNKGMSYCMVCHMPMWFELHDEYPIHYPPYSKINLYTLLAAIRYAKRYSEVTKTELYAAKMFTYAWIYSRR